MIAITREALLEAQRAIASVIYKCEKAAQSLSKRSPPPKAQLTLLERRLSAMQIAMTLIEQELQRIEETSAGDTDQA